MVLCLMYQSSREFKLLFKEFEEETVRHLSRVSNKDNSYNSQVFLKVYLFLSQCFKNQQSLIITFNPPNQKLLELPSWTKNSLRSVSAFFLKPTMGRRTDVYFLNITPFLIWIMGWLAVSVK